MKLLKRFSSNAKLAADGKEFLLTENGWLTIRRADSKAVVDYRTEHEEKFRPLIEAGGKIPENKLREILVKTAANVLIVGIRGTDWLDDNDPRIDPKDESQTIVWAEDPSESEESRKAWLEKVLSEPDYEPLLDKIYSLATKFENFRDSEVEAVRKN